MRIVQTIAIIIAICLLAVAAAATELTQYEISTAQRESLERGEYIVEVWRDKERSDGAIDAFGSIDIQASPAIVWRMMLDCEKALMIVKAMTTCEILDAAPDGSWDIRKQKIKVGPLLPKGTSVFRSTYEVQKSIKIELLSGNMKVQDGLWILTALENGKTRVSYRAALRPKFPVPKSILKKGVRNDMPVVLQNMKMYAEMAQKDVMAAETVSDVH